jgi:hypothetical protein
MWKSRAVNIMLTSVTCVRSRILGEKLTATLKVLLYRLFIQSHRSELRHFRPHLHPG